MNFRTKSDMSSKPGRISGNYNPQINELDLIDDIHHDSIKSINLSNEGGHPSNSSTKNRIDPN